MTVLYVILGMSLTTVGYFGIRFWEFRKREEKRERELNVKVACLLQEFQQGQKPAAPFREMAIDQLSRQTLVYIPETGLYERRREIK